jgi:hypothetical protein
VLHSAFVQKETVVRMKGMESAEQIGRQIAEHTEELNSLMRAMRSGWMHAVDTVSLMQKDEELEEILETCCVRIKSNHIEIYGNEYVTPLLPTEDRLRQFVYAVFLSVQQQHAPRVVKLFVDAMAGDLGVIAVDAQAFRPGGAATHVASILSACLSPTKCNEYPLVGVTYPPKTALRNEKYNPCAGSPVTKVMEINDDRMHSACFEHENAVFFTLRFKSDSPWTKFSWSAELQCPIDQNHLRLHLPEGKDGSTYPLLNIQRFKPFQYSHAVTLSHDLANARSLARSPHELAYGFNPWKPMGDETTEFLLAGCLHQLLLFRYHPERTHTITNYYFKKMSERALVTNVFESSLHGVDILSENHALFALKFGSSNSQCSACVDSEYAEILVAFH